jgi:cytochrome c-type biogenesis protein CcmH/NrfF
VTGPRVLAVAAAALALAAPAAACTKPRASLPSLEGQVMCPTCHTTLDQSDSAVATRIRAYIARRIGECATAGQIKQELVEQFGPAILAAPPRHGFDLLAWWLPIAGILAAALAIGAGVWRWSRSREPEPPERLDPESERRVDEALAGFDG